MRFNFYRCRHSTFGLAIHTHLLNYPSFPSFLFGLIFLDRKKLLRADTKLTGKELASTKLKAFAFRSPSSSLRTGPSVLT